MDTTKTNKMKGQAKMAKKSKSDLLVVVEFLNRILADSANVMMFRLLHFAM